MIPAEVRSATAAYKTGAEVGRGGHSVVTQAMDVSSGRFYAVKHVRLADLDADDLGAMELEIALLRQLRHPSVLQYVDVARTSTYLHIVTELEESSLDKVLKRFGPVEEPVAATYTRQILQGLTYLHEQGVLHRDVKAANTLITKDGRVKIADFGIAMQVAAQPPHSTTTTSSSSSSSSSSSTTTTGSGGVSATLAPHPGLHHQQQPNAAGSPYWMAPEIIELSTSPTTACDIWSLGCTLMELLTGSPPYFDLEPMTALFRIVTDDSPAVPGAASSRCRDFLLRGCFPKEPLRRATAPQLLEHPWLLGLASVAPAARTAPAPTGGSEKKKKKKQEGERGAGGRSLLHTFERGRGRIGELRQVGLWQGGLRQGGGGGGVREIEDGDGDGDLEPGEGENWDAAFDFSEIDNHGDEQGEADGDKVGKCSNVTVASERKAAEQALARFTERGVCGGSPVFASSSADGINSLNFADVDYEEDDEDEDEDEGRASRASWGGRECSDKARGKEKKSGKKSICLIFRERMASRADGVDFDNFDFEDDDDDDDDNDNDNEVVGGGGGSCGPGTFSREMPFPGNLPQDSSSSSNGSSTSTEVLTQQTMEVLRCISNLQDAVDDEEDKVEDAVEDNEDEFDDSEGEGGNIDSPVKAQAKAATDAACEADCERLLRFFGAIDDSCGSFSDAHGGCGDCGGCGGGDGGSGLSRRRHFVANHGVLPLLDLLHSPPLEQAAVFADHSRQRRRRRRRSSRKDRRACRVGVGSVESQRFARARAVSHSAVRCLLAATEDDPRFAVAHLAMVGAFPRLLRVFLVAIDDDESSDEVVDIENGEEEDDEEEEEEEEEEEGDDAKVEDGATSKAATLKRRRRRRRIRTRQRRLQRARRVENRKRNSHSFVERGSGGGSVLMDPSLLPEAAALVSHIALHSTIAVLQMFVASGGLPLLVAILSTCHHRDDDYGEFEFGQFDDSDNDGHRRQSSTSSRSIESSSWEVSSLDSEFELSRVAVDALLRVLLLRGTIPTNDMCRLLAVQLQLLPSLAAVWHRCLDACAASMAPSRGGGNIEKDESDDDDDDDAGIDGSQEGIGGGLLSSVSAACWANLDGIARILGCMARSSPSSVKETFSCCGISRSSSSCGSGDIGTSGSCLRGMMRALSMPLFVAPEEPTALVALELLKCLKDLSMDPVTLNAIEFAGGIPVLVALLGVGGSSGTGGGGDDTFGVGGESLDRGEPSAVALLPSSSSSPSPSPPLTARSAWLSSGSAAATASPFSGQRWGLGGGKSGSSGASGSRLSTGGLRQQIEATALQCLFYLCRLSRRRQEQAAVAGIVPQLQRFVALPESNTSNGNKTATMTDGLSLAGGSGGGGNDGGGGGSFTIQTQPQRLQGMHDYSKGQFRQFALPILCDLPHTSQSARAELGKHRGVELYLSLLDDAYWKIPALHALAAWLHESSPADGSGGGGGEGRGTLSQEAVERALIAQLPRLLACLAGLRNSSGDHAQRFFSMENGLAALYAMQCKSPRLTRALAGSGDFVAWLVARLAEVSLDNDDNEGVGIVVSTTTSPFSTSNLAVTRRAILQVMLRTLRDGTDLMDPAAAARAHMSGLEPILIALSRGDSQYILIRETSRELLDLIRQ